MKRETKPPKRRGCAAAAAGASTDAVAKAAREPLVVQLPEPAARPGDVPPLPHGRPAALPLPEPLAWAREYLPDYFTDEPAAFHAELMGDLAAAQRRLIARVAPRGHAKSTCAACAYPLWCICEQRRRNIVIVTHAAPLATQFVRDLRQELECNEAIRLAYGDLCEERAALMKITTRGARRPRSRPSTRQRASGGDAAVQPVRKRRVWKEDRFTTTTGITVQAKGAGAALRGMRVGPQRPDLIICDDIEKDEHVATAAQRRKLEHWLRCVVMPALAPDGQLLVLGSLIHYDSLLANLRDRRRFPRWDYRVYRALEAEPDGAGQFRLLALWPGRWPVAKLEEERERVGTLAFEQEYQANPSDAARRVFRPEWLQRYEPADLEGQPLVTLMAIDPATGAEKGDYFALWVGSVVPGGNIYTRVLTLERVGIVEQVQRILAACAAWKPVRIGIESTAYQVALKQVLEEESRQRGLYLPLVALRTHINKKVRIEGTAPLYESGRFRLPPVLAPEVEKQFLHFPDGDHDDAPDVCAMGIELARALQSARIEGATRRRNPYVRDGGW